MSVSKPFLFALVCETIGPEEARAKLGANATGLPFNSLAAIEQGGGRTNPMVNAGAIATTSLAPGATAEARWTFIHDGLSRFAGRALPLNEEVYASASQTNFRNRSIARLLESRGSRPRLAEARLRALKIGLLIMAGLALIAIIPAGRLPNYLPGEIPSDEAAAKT
jgi:glutaminase